MSGPKIALHDPASVGLSAERLGRIDRFVKGLVDKGQRPNGMVLVARHGKPVYCRGFGMQNDGSNDSLQSAPRDLQQDTIFRMYSMSKPITSVALMMLYEEGEFLLTDPAWMYLGEEWRKERMEVWKSGSQRTNDLVTEPCTEDITIKHLLTHTSGISYGFDEGGESNPVDYLYNQAQVEGDSSTTLTQFVANLAAMPLLFQPGSRWQYGFNTSLCGLLVELIGGMPFEEFLRKRVFAPLGMVDTGFWCPPEKVHRLADCYEERPEPKPGQQRLKNVSRQSSQQKYTKGLPANCSGGGGLLSTMHDYMRFCQCLSNGGELDGARLLSVKTVEWMATNHLPGGQDMDDLRALPAGYAEAQGPGLGFGLGFSVKRDPVAHGLVGSVGTIAWGGAANTYFWIDPKERLFAIWLTQCLEYDERKAPARSKLQALVYGSIADRLPFQPA